MSPDIPPAPPEAEVIRLARLAADMSAQDAAEASRAHDGRGVSAAYWRDVERGAGGRRGERVPVRASARALAAMARVVGVTPAQLAGAGRQDAARVLEEILRREEAARAAPVQLRPTGIRVIDEAASGEDLNLAPFEWQIEREIADAEAEQRKIAKAQGKREEDARPPTGEEIFGPGHEADAWNSRMMDRDATVRALALFRLFAFQNRGGQAGSRTGLRLARVPAGLR